MLKLSLKDYQTRVHETKTARMVGDRIYRLERNISVIASYSLLKLFPNLLPTSVSIINVLLVLSVLGLNFFKNTDNIFIWVLIQLVILRLTIIGDHVDGEIARFKNYFTQGGIYFDLAFHFFYPFAFIFSIGYSFYLYFDNLLVMLLATSVGLLMTHYKILGKLRHHIRYKTELENHGHLLRDYRLKNLVPHQGLAGFRFIRYLLFFIYDWVWFLYLVLISGAVFLSPIFGWIYLIHLGLMAVVLFIQIFSIYPKYYLFLEEDFNTN